MSITQLTLELIRQSATHKSWQRGESYYDQGCVRQVNQRGNLISAEVIGSSLYSVSIEFADHDILTASCTCPYDWGGYCKHIVATLLFCLREPEHIQVRATLEEILDRLNEIQTQSLIQQLAAKKPELVNDIERITDRLAPPVVVTTEGSSPQKKVTVNVNAIRSQVRYILEDSVRHYEYGGEEDPATEEICSLIEEASNYNQQGDSDNAIAMLTAITESCLENWDLVDEYGVDYDDVAYLLSRVWCETILNGKLDEADKVDLQVNFEYWRDSWGNCFDILLAALEQGWSNPALKRILQGNVSSNIWTGEAPPYAEDLAAIRLDILERQGRLEEYLYFAEASGQVVEYLTKLVSLGRISEAMTAAQSLLANKEDALALSRCLVTEQNAQVEALAIARAGLGLPGSCQYDLATWTSEIALELDDQVTAVKAKVKAFQASPNFADYRQVAQLAGDNWSNLKGELLGTLAADDSWNSAAAKVDIHLDEGMIKQAIAVVENVGDYRHRSATS
ncbi:MAG: SWIM zinc finger family protein [Cyanobacteria bacterium J06558_2]